jgi:hypothetical protein
MAVTTEFEGYTWDFVLKDPGDVQLWYDRHVKGDLTEEEILHLSFRPLLPSSQGKLSEEFIELLQQLPVKPLTTVQSSGQDWFFLRFLMLTSRSVGKMVDVYNGDEDVLIHNISWTKIKQYIRRTSSQPAPPVPETEDTTPSEAPVPATEDTPPEAALLAPSVNDNPDTSSTCVAERLTIVNIV